jgi:hypothetical protein
MRRSDARGGSGRDAGGVARRGVVAALVLLLGSMPGPIAAEGKVGVHELSSSAPIFPGVERGIFRDFGIEPELALPR